ncbi:CvpA family protein [bacterium]|nr:CvpA family protein [bacterium]
MNFFDLLVILVVAGLGITGFRDGLIRQAVKLVGLIVSVVVLAVFSDFFIGLAQNIRFLPAKIAVPLVFYSALIIGLVIFAVLAAILSRMIHLTPIGFIDSGLGTAFGILKALLLCGVIAVALSFTSPGSFLGGQFRSSRTAGPLSQLVSESIPFVKKSVSSFYRLFPSMPEKPEPENNEHIEQNPVI